MKKSCLLLLTVLAGLVGVQSVVAETMTKMEALNLLPWPKTVENKQGDLVYSPNSGWKKKDASEPPSPRDFQTFGDCLLTPQTRIVATDPALVPLSRVLADEIKSVFNLSLAVAEAAQPGDNDIVLQLNPQLADEEYVLEADRGVRITGGNYAAAAMGTATLLQALDRSKDGVLMMPVITIKDSPQASYRGLMVDVARSWHSIETLKQCVELCRFYKINTFHLHLSDLQSFMFPTRAFPQLAKPWWGAEKVYSIEDLKDLVAFAKDRGVQVLPEIEMPGHSGSLLVRMPELFACDPSTPGHAICAGNEAVYAALDKMIGEAVEIFDTTPYFHIGADEVPTSQWKQCRRCQAYMKGHGLDNEAELYRHFLVRMDEIVKKHGRKMIVWEGFHREGKTVIPKDVTVMVFDSLYNTAPDLIEQGYPVINAAWKPLYVVREYLWPPADIYSSWNKYQFGHWYSGSKACPDSIRVNPTPLLLGAQMCAWEQREEIELPSLRRRLPAMSERLWSPDTGLNVNYFLVRLSPTDVRLGQLIGLPPSNQGAYGR